MSRLYGEILKKIHMIFLELLPFENFEIWHRNFANAISQKV